MRSYHALYVANGCELESDSYGHLPGSNGYSVIQCIYYVGDALLQLYVGTDARL